MAWTKRTKRVRREPRDYQKQTFWLRSVEGESLNADGSIKAFTPAPDAKAVWVTECLDCGVHFDQALRYHARFAPDRRCQTCSAIYRLNVAMGLPVKAWALPKPKKVKPPPTEAQLRMRARRREKRAARRKVLRERKAARRKAVLERREARKLANAPQREETAKRRREKARLDRQVWREANKHTEAFKAAKAKEQIRYRAKRAHLRFAAYVLRLALNDIRKEARRQLAADWKAANSPKVEKRSIEEIREATRTRVAAHRRRKREAGDIGAPMP